MDGFTPSFVLQLLIGVGSAGAVYGAVRSDLNNMARSLTEDRRLREEHAREDDKTHHDIRNELQQVRLDQARLDGKQTLATDLMDAIRGKQQ